MNQTTIEEDDVTVELSKRDAETIVRALKLLANADSVENSIYLPPAECIELHELATAVEAETL